MHWFKFRGQTGGVAEIAILSEIGGFGVTAEDFYNQLQSLTGVSELRIIISSDGGDIFQGFAIYNMLRRFNAKKTVVIEGLAASMASVIAMVGDTITMPENSMMMIHNPFGGIVGEAENIISFGEALNEMRGKIITAYTSRTGLPKREVARMMNRETWLKAEKAVSLGFADKIEKPMKIAAQFNWSKFGKGLKMSKNLDRDPNAELFGDEGDDSPKTEEQIRNEILAQQNEIRALCKLAGKPDKAEGFISENKTVPDVMKALQKEADDATENEDGDEIDTNHRPKVKNQRGGSSIELNTAKIYARWNSAARPFENQRAGASPD